MMAKHSKLPSKAELDVVEVKSKFAAEFRRFSLNRKTCIKCDDFHELVATLHGLQNIPFVTCYTDPKDGDLLPINNDDNFYVALSSGKSVLRLIIQRRGDVHEVNGYGGTMTRKRNPITKLIQGEPRPRPNIAISLPEDFRRVSAIIDVGMIPETHRRVKLMKNGTDKPLGFYIRDGTSVRMTPQGLEKVPGIFISRLVPGGLAESTGLLAVNDEVLEVNGIEVSGKTLDQVTDMMVANSANLIVTVKPVNQRNNIGPRYGSGRQSEKSTESFHSAKSFASDEVHEIEEEEDEVLDFLQSEEGNKEVPEEGATGQDTETIDLEEQTNFTEAKEEEETPEKDSKSDKDKDSAVVTL